jgi:Sulfotransferase domain
VLDELTPSERGPLRSYSTRDRGRERARGKVERPRLRERAEGAGAEFVSCITADADQLDALRPERAFHVIRDPRDIIVSGYFSHRNSRPADHPAASAWGLAHIAAHRERLLSVDKEEGLLLEMEFARQELLDLAEWDYERPEVLEVRMEDLSARPYEGFVDIFRHLELLPGEEPSGGRELASVWARRTLNRISSRRGLTALRRPMPATAEILLGAVYGLRFEAATKGRRAGVEDTASHYRKGVAGDWVNHFTQVHVDAFDERYGGLLERLGYETEAMSLAGSS